MTMCKKCGKDFEKESKRGRPWSLCERCRIIKTQLAGMPEEEQREVI